MKITRILWFRSTLGAITVGLIPGVTSAHTIGGTNNWVDELTCAVPAGILLLVVFILGKPTKPHANKPVHREDENRNHETLT